jgi:hypothetical protein
MRLQFDVAHSCLRAMSGSIFVFRKRQSSRRLDLQHRDLSLVALPPFDLMLFRDVHYDRKLRLSLLTAYKSALMLL